MAMTRDELVKLGYQIVNFEGFDEEHTRLLNLFSENVPHPNGSNLFYYPENFNARRDDLSKYNPTVEEVVDMALNYKPLQL